MKYRLTKELRKKLKEPFGKIEKDPAYKKMNRPLITVGDVSTYKALEQNVIPNLMIYDNKKEREPVPQQMKEKIESQQTQKINVKNPASHITQEAEKEIQKALESKENKKISVDGEEDLLTLICIREAPIGSTICYGQPNQGTVIINVQNQQKQKANKILEKMEDKKWK